MRIGFLGTGKLAQPVFAALCDSSHQVVGLVTQPDRTGRGHHQHVNPLKELAVSRGIPVHQPEKIRTPDSIEVLQSWQVDLFVVAAYGQMLPKTVLEMPRLGCINVHASLLPKYRGATPIHAAILNGDAETGVTIIRLVKELDAGPMLGSVTTAIRPGETTGELEERLAELSPSLTLRVVDELANGTATEVPQDAAQATHVGKLTKDDGWIDWNRTAVEIERHIRGMQPWPGAFALLAPEGRPPLRIKILSATARDRYHYDTGVIAAVTKDTIVVQCGGGDLTIHALQPDGKRAMSASDFLRGHLVHSGDYFQVSKSNSD
jgi:methionyl-tRNA formyltransferase